MQSLTLTAMDFLMLLPLMLHVMPTTNNRSPNIPHNNASDVSSKATDNKEADLNNNHHRHDHTAPLPAPQTK